MLAGDRFLRFHEPDHESKSDGFYLYRTDLRHKRYNLSNNQDRLMTGILKLAHLSQGYSVAHVQLRVGRVDAQLDSQGLLTVFGSLPLLLQFFLSINRDRTSGHLLKGLIRYESHTISPRHCPAELRVTVPKSSMPEQIVP